MREVLNPFDAFAGIGAVSHQIAQTPNLVKGRRISQYGLQGRQVGMNVRYDQIAHNVIIGKNCIIVAQAGISGSTVLGNNVTLAGQAGIVGHITIGDNAIVAAQGGVTKSVPANTMVSGYPAKPHGHARRVNACVQRLPQLFKVIEELKAKVESLENKLKTK